jgi:hypothetical protein
MLQSAHDLRKLSWLLGLTLAVGSACADDEPPSVSSDEQARRAYLGLDDSIDKALNLGMQGFNEASSANISPQSTDGDVSGTLTVSGQVDQGASANKEMRLFVDLLEYSDGAAVRVDDEDINITYDTDPADLPSLDLSLRNIPDGTFTGTLLGRYLMHGDLEGEVLLDLSLAGEIEDDGSGGIRRTLGTTQISGTAVSGEGVYVVELTI